MLSKWINKLIIILFVVCAALLLKDCIGKYIPTEPKPNERLKDHEKERIAINDRGDVVKTVRGKGNNKDSQVAYRDTGAGETVVTINNDGTISVSQETHGFIFRPGACLSSTRDGLYIGADVQFYYFRNFGANVGVTSAVGEDFGSKYRAHIATSYRLPFQSFRNTSLYVGIDTKKEITFGARLRF